jgi:hypothetical protein
MYGPGEFDASTLNATARATILGFASYLTANYGFMRLANPAGLFPISFITVSSDNSVTVPPLADHYSDDSEADF